MYTQDSVQQRPEDLVLLHGPLVKRIAHHLMARLPSSVQVEDLIQAGMIGLLEAAANYESGKGASFETFAGIRIRGAMIDDVRRGDWAPRSVHRNSRRVAGAIRDVESRTGTDASDAEVALEMGVSLEEYHSILQDTRGSRLHSLDELVDSETGADAHLGDTIDEPSLKAADERMAADLAEAIEGLPEREKLVLSLYYDQELNLKEIGQIIDVSESRVSQIMSQATKRLRSRLSDW